MGKRIYMESRNYFKPVITGTVTSIVSSVALLVIFSVFMLLQNMPRNSGFFLSFIVISLASMIGGFVCVRMARCKGMILGAVVGFIFIFIISMVGVIAGFSVNFLGSFMLKALLAVAFGAIGGIIATNIRMGR